MQPTEKQLAQFKASSEKAGEWWAELMDKKWSELIDILQWELNRTLPVHNWPKIVMLGRVASEAYYSLERHKSIVRYLKPYFSNKIIKNVLKKRNSLHR